MAEAAGQMGFKPVIFSRKEKSSIPGSQHLQGHIPHVTPPYPDSAVTFVRMGTKEDYADKVYGDPLHPCGWPNYDGVHRSWSVFKAYDLLWDRHQDKIVDMTIDAHQLVGLQRNFDVILSTIPQPVICVNHHEFDSVPYWIQPRMTPTVDAHREIVVFNGLPQDSWYRWSILGRKESLESTTPLLHAEHGRKAIDNNCNCWPGIIRLGRWAQWKHGVLLHHAFNEACAALKGAKNG